MFTLEKRQALALASVLAMLMAATRSHHFATLAALPDASWAVFFAAGVYLRGRWVFPAFFALAAVVDAYAIMIAGVSSFCVTSAYLFLVPAYGALWAGGRWVAHRLEISARSLAQGVCAVGVSALVCELIASGSFYFIGERFADPTLAGFLPRLLEYFPRTLGVMYSYLAAGALLHLLVAGVIARRTAFPATGR